MRISQVKIDKIKEEILSTIFRNSPRAMFTSDIASEIARDEEFCKKLLIELEQKGLVASVKKNNNGKDYLQRIRWRLTNSTFQAYQSISGQKVEYDDNEHTYI